MTKEIIIKPGIGHLDKAICTSILGCTERWHSAGFTPNMLTTLGNVCSFLCIYFYYKNNLLSIPFLILRTYFDYVDGMVARTYNLATDFGDTYDHMSDALFGALFIAVTAKTLKGKHRNLSLILITIFMLSFVINMGCIDEIEPNELFKLKTFVSDGQNHIKDRK